MSALGPYPARVQTVHDGDTIYLEGRPLSVDKRDPQALGQYLLAVHEQYPDTSICLIADGEGSQYVKDYDGGESMLTLTLLDRQIELQKRAEQGDRFAAAILAGDSLAEEVAD